MFKLKEQAILIISNEPWGDIWYSKHNWAYELSKSNQVFFINAPKRWSFKDLFCKKLTVNDYSESLKIIDYNNKVPFTRFEFLYNLNERIVTKLINKYLKSKGIKKTVFWSFDPYRFPNPKLLNAAKSIFFRVDKFLLLKRERKLLENVDGLVVTAEVLLQGTFSKKHLILSHGISEDEFKPTINNIKYNEGFLIYVGNIDYRMDVKLLKKLLIAFPEQDFLFIGKLVDTDNETFQEIFFEKKYPNLILHGIEHFKNLKNYIYKSKACLAPMDISIDGNEIHHHKSLQYLAMGKPIISPIFNDSINNDEMILGYKNSDEAIDRIKNLECTETNEKVKNRIDYSKQFLYANLIKEVEHFLN
ncbi:MAG: hypothetical protein P1U41_02005 [Vicingaceae bacterium]|nr:hypothetical protein [Vicingaceae bacterium]